MRRLRTTLLPLWALGLAAGGGAVPGTARACGGFFCNGVQPVIQTGEAIIFAVDRTGNTVEATINISYQGQAQDFAWILPLRSAPSKIALGSSWAFSVMQQATAPRFVINEVEQRGVCTIPPLAAGGFDEGDGTRGQSPTGGPAVLTKAPVGPYDTVVLAGRSAGQIRDWLASNGYNVTGAMMQQVVPYVEKGDVLLALKLRKDQSTGDIQPIRLWIPGTEACVPLRLTAIAAQDDMQVLVAILSNEGRAIPDNYLHVRPNLARIDWLGGGSNYSQVIAAAVDEANGNAFTTEFAGSARLFDGRIYSPTAIDLEVLSASPRVDDFLAAAARMGLLGRSEMAGILTRAVTEEVLAQAGLSRNTFDACVACAIGRFGAATLDSMTAVEEIRERIVEPERTTQETFDRFSYFTRLNTFISPAEMTLDPIFSFRADLPDVKNVHGAKQILDCGIGGAPGSAGVTVVLEDGTSISFDSSGNQDRTELDTMPAAAAVEQLAQRVVVRDNSGAIIHQLEAHNARQGLGCGCAATARRPAGFLSFFGAALLGCALLLRRRR